MEPPHFLLVPYSEVGHLNPMLSLAVRLAALGCKVSFATLDREGQPQYAADEQTGDAAANLSAATIAKPCRASGTDAAEAAAAQPKENNSDEVVKTGPAPAPQFLDNLRFLTLSNPNDTADPKAVVRHQVLKKKMDSIDHLKDSIVKMIEDAMDSPHPITCVIHEAFHLSWVRDVVKAYGLRSALFSTCSALGFLELNCTLTGKESELEAVYEAGLGMARKAKNYTTGLISRRTTPEMQMQMQKFYISLFQGMQDAGPFLLNSFKELEASLLPTIEGLGIEVSFIGPCLPPWNLHNGGIWRQLTQKAGIPYTEDTTCLNWLDEQEKGSVLYVSFGSEGNIEKNQVEEIEIGIRGSGYKFLWVVRIDGLSSNMPTTHGAGEDKTGMLVSWAPQRDVLRHPSVGGFLTHCGWTSVLEAVDAGVPMLCLPLQADQPMNAGFVCSCLRAGLQLKVPQEGLVHREDVTNGVRAVMQGQFRERLSKLRDASRSASTRDADQELTVFVQAMR